MCKKKGSYSDVFKGAEEQLFFSKFNLEFDHQSYREIAAVWAKNISLPGIAVAEKRRVYIFIHFQRS
jgi:hypothetical protein